MTSEVSNVWVSQCHSCIQNPVPSIYLKSVEENRYQQTTSHLVGEITEFVLCAVIEEIRRRQTDWLLVEVAEWGDNYSNFSLFLNCKWTAVTLWLAKWLREILGAEGGQIGVALVDHATLHNTTRLDAGCTRAEEWEMERRDIHVSYIQQNTNTYSI